MSCCLPESALTDDGVHAGVPEANVSMSNSTCLLHKHFSSAESEGQLAARRLGPGDKAAALCPCLKFTSCLLLLTSHSHAL